MQWFKHDADASTDAKIKKLVMRYGADGYAIYFHCIELIVGNLSEQNITFELEHDAEIIADNLKIQGTSDTSPVDRVNQIMKYIISLGLFEESNGHITCYKILKRLDCSMTSNSKMRALITGAKQNHDKVMINSDVVMQEENRIDKIRLDKKRTDKEPAKACYPQEAEELSDLLYTLHREVDSKYKADWKRWEADIDKLNRIDGRSWEEIKSVIKWCKTPNNFWFPNICSGKKLREKFATMKAQMMQPKKEYVGNKELKVNTRTTFLDLD